MNKTLLIVGAGGEAVEGIRLARSMGIHVVASDANPDAPGFVIAHDTLLASTYDIERTVAEALRYHNTVRPINGVMCIASDVPLTVARVATTLGLPGISIDSARLATDKLAMKERFRADGVPIPWFSAVEAAEHLKELVEMHGFPLVIKPVDSRGARGVLQLKSGVDLDWAYASAKHFSPTGRVILERFLPGPQVSTESLVIERVAHTPGFADRNYEYMERFAPHIIENGGQLPSHLSTEVQQAVCDLVQKAAESMGIKNGVVKGDIVVSEGEPHVIELAARLSGGYFCTHEIPLNTGVDLVGAAIRQALGEPVDPADLVPKFSKPVAQRYFFPDPGRVVSVDVPDWINTDPEIAYFELRIKRGDTVPPPIHHPARAGVVIATGHTSDLALAKARSVVSALKIVTQRALN